MIQGHSGLFSMFEWEKPPIYCAIGGIEGGYHIDSKVVKQIENILIQHLIPRYYDTNHNSKVKSIESKVKGDCDIDSSFLNGTITSDPIKWINI